MAAAIAAVQKYPKVLPPPSPFGELLRRSRFASYDPDIRQAYSAPPSYIHRGNWGLKRPIANRHRKGHIVLRQFEEHAQYVEWDRADSQVKFIKRVEELGTAPTLVPNSSWFRGLGQAATAKASGLDSDFCPGELSEFERLPDERVADEKFMGSPRPLPPHMPVEGEAAVTVASESKAEPTAESSSSSSSNNTNTIRTTTLPLQPKLNLDDLGNRGKGSYGAKGPPPKPLQQRADEARLQPNINAMTPAEFTKYVEKLRKLRPQFLKYIREQLVRDRENNRRIMSATDPKDLADKELVINLGMEAKKKSLHMAFLGRYTEEHLYSTVSEEKGDPLKAAALANTPQPIQKQPHKFGGLLYAQPSELESFYHVKPAPGFVLQDTKPSSGSYLVADAADGQYIAAFAGFTSYLQKKDAGIGASPLYEPFTDIGLQAPREVDPVTGKVTFNTEDSERKMRMISLELEETPRAVGSAASNRPLSLAKFRSFVVVDNGVDQNFRENPYPPGSKEYNAVMPMAPKASLPLTRAPRYTQNYFGKVSPVAAKLGSGNFKGKLPTRVNDDPKNSAVLGSLSAMIKDGSFFKASNLGRPAAQDSAGAEEPGAEAGPEGDKGV